MTPAPTIEPSFCADAFSLTPDPRRLFLSRGHAEALAGLRLGLQYRRGLIVVVGEVGTGKTTVAYSLLDALGDEARTAYIANTRLPFVALLRHALEDFGVDSAARDRGGSLSALKHFLLECAQSGQMAVLVVDEAQGLDAETFEQLRLLSNVETYEHKLLQIVLLGQPELAERLRQPELRQIAERVAVRVNINPLDRAESRRYIEHRLGSGGSLAMFSPAALRLIIYCARGIPRRLNILCHNALLLAFAAGASQVTWSMAREAIRDRMGGELVRRRSSIADPAQWLGRRRVWAAGACAALAAGVMAGRDVLDAPPRDVGTAVAKTASAGVISAATAGPAADGPVAEHTAAPLDASGGPVAAPLPAAGDDPPAVAVTTAGTEADPPSAIAAEAVSETASSEPSSSERQVMVSRGTTLIHIARRFYGANDPALIRRIMQANPTISDPDFIVAGSKLILPLVEPPREKPATRSANREKRA